MFSGSRNSKTLLRILPDVAGSRKSKLAADTPEAEERQFEHSFNLWRQHVASCLFQHAAFNILLVLATCCFQHVAFNMLPVWTGLKVGSVDSDDEARLFRE